MYECLWHWLWHIKTTAYIIIPSHPIPYPAKDPKLVFCHVTMIKSNFMTHSHSKTAKTDGRAGEGERTTPLHLLVRQPSLSLADAHILSICQCVCVCVSLCNDSGNIKGAAFKSALYTAQGRGMPHSVTRNWCRGIEGIGGRGQGAGESHFKFKDSS